MKKMIRCEIPFEQGYAYLFDSLSQVNELSKQVISLIDFKSGNFFTIVDKNFEKKNLCYFK